MTDIDQLIHLNIELEGLLKVLRDRDSEEARNLLADKIEQYTSGINSLLGDYDYPAFADEEISEEVKTGEAIAEEAEHEEIKLQEAVETEVVPEEDAAEAAVATEMAHRAEPNERLLKAFTLNDRFRYRRELFGGDDADFNDTLRLLAEMDSYAEACDYLYNDMMWDKSDPNVADFMAIVAANMPQ